MILIEALWRQLEVSIWVLKKKKNEQSPQEDEDERQLKPKVETKIDIPSYNDSIDANKLNY